MLGLSAGAAQPPSAYHQIPIRCDLTPGSLPEVVAGEYRAWSGVALIEVPDGWEVDQRGFYPSLASGGLCDLRKLLFLWEHCLSDILGYAGCCRNSKWEAKRVCVSGQRGRKNPERERQIHLDSTPRKTNKQRCRGRNRNKDPASIRNSKKNMKIETMEKCKETDTQGNNMRKHVFST